MAVRVLTLEEKSLQNYEKLTAPASHWTWTAITSLFPLVLSGIASVVYLGLVFDFFKITDPATDYGRVSMPIGDSYTLAPWLVALFATLLGADSMGMNLYQMFYMFREAVTRNLEKAMNATQELIQAYREDFHAYWSFQWTAYLNEFVRDTIKFSIIVPASSLVPALARDVEWLAKATWVGYVLQIANIFLFEPGMNDLTRKIDVKHLDHSEAAQITRRKKVIVEESAAYLTRVAKAVRRGHLDLPAIENLPLHDADAIGGAAAPAVDEGRALQRIIALDVAADVAPTRYEQGLDILFFILLFGVWFGSNLGNLGTAWIQREDFWFFPAAFTAAVTIIANIGLGLKMSVTTAPLLTSSALSNQATDYGQLKWTIFWYGMSLFTSIPSIFTSLSLASNDVGLKIALVLLAVFGTTFANGFACGADVNAAYETARLRETTANRTQFAAQIESTATALTSMNSDRALELIFQHTTSIADGVETNTRLGHWLQQRVPELYRQPDALNPLCKIDETLPVDRRYNPHNESTFSRNLQRTALVTTNMLITFSTFAFADYRSTLSVVTFLNAIQLIIERYCLSTSKAKKIEQHSFQEVQLVTEQTVASLGVTGITVIAQLLILPGLLEFMFKFDANISAQISAILAGVIAAVVTQIVGVDYAKCALPAPRSLLLPTCA